MIDADGSFGFPTKTLHVHSARPLAKANDFQRDCTIETLLSCAKYHALATATDFLQQFVIAQLSKGPREALACLNRTCWLIRMAGVIPRLRDYRFFVE